MRTPVRGTGARVVSARGVAALGVALLLTACSTTVAGTGRPGAAVSGGQNSGTPTSSTSPSPSSSATGAFDASGDAHEAWEAAIEATISTGGSVVVGGEISGAGIGGAAIKATYSTDDDGNPTANVMITTPEGGQLIVAATGGEAWAQAPASVYEEYGYDADVAEQADGQPVLLTDDDSGLDVYAALETFLDLCGPSTGDPASLEDGTYDGRTVLVVNDEEYDTKAYVDPADGHVLASVYEDQTVEFVYTDDTTPVNAPPESNVITVDGI